jgi:hypothetical protein
MFVAKSLDYLLGKVVFKNIVLFLNYISNTVVTHSPEPVQLSRNDISTTPTKTEDNLLMPNCRVSSNMITNISVFIRDQNVIEIKVHFSS